MINLEGFKTYVQNKRNLAGLVVLLILILAIPLGIYLVRNTQIFRPKAEVEGIISLAQGSCVAQTTNGGKVLTCKDVPLRLISPFNESSPSPSASPQACNPKKYDENIWNKTTEECVNGKQRVIYSCQDKTKTKKQKCGGTTGPIEQSPFNGPHNIPGRIEAEDFDNGGEGVAYHLEKKKSNKYRKNEDVETYNSNESDKVGYNIGLGTGEWVEYTFNAQSEGVYKLETRIASKNGGKFHLEIDGQNKTGQISVPENKDFVTLSKDGISLDQGEHLMRFVVEETAKNKTLGDINYFEFKSAPTAGLLKILKNNFTIDTVNAQSPTCDPKKFDKNTWSITGRGECKKGKQIITYTCEGKTKEKKEVSEDCQASSPSPGSGSSSGIFYRLAETEAGLESAVYQAYSQNPTLITFTLANETPGPKQIWVEFKNKATGQKIKDHITVSLIDQSSSSPSPSPSASSGTGGPASPSPSSSSSSSPSPSPSASAGTGGPASPSPSSSSSSSPSPSPSPFSGFCSNDSNCPAGYYCPQPSCPPGMGCDPICIPLSSSPSPSNLACPTPPVCPAGQVMIFGDPLNPNVCPLYQCVDSPSVSPSPSPSAEVGGPKEVVYRLAETEAGLNSAEYKLYSQNPTVTTFTLENENPGVKQIWVEFKNNATGEIKKERITLKFIKRPKIQTADCTLDINKQDLKVTISGSDFGDGRGKVKTGQTELDILDWKNNQVSWVSRKPEIAKDNGKTFQFNLTRSDNVPLEEPIICRVDTSIIALGARAFCRDTGKFDVPNVKVTLKDQSSNSIEEKVTITKEGLVSGLKTRLQAGKKYILSIKAPNSLRRNAIFTAGVGTTFVSREDGSPVILPIGDIAPVILPDGKINTLDRAEIVRQWSVLGKGTQSTGDFNKDNRVNSIDWACMRYDFNQGDESVPDASILLPTPTPTPTPSQAASPTPSPSSAGSPSPSASSQRAAYFLPEASGSGTYSINSEFAVDINIWSQNEAANLFSARMIFDATALEVVKIDHGTALTSWTDSSFNNSAGKISLIAGLPSPGLKTVEGNDPLMAKITFKAKKAGNTVLSMETNSAIYANSDNVNIISGLISATVVITQ